MQRDYRTYLDDITDAIANIGEYTQDLDFDEETLTEFNKWSIGKEVKLCEKASNNKDFINALNGIDTKNSIRVGFSVGTTYQTLIKMIEERDIDLAKDIVNELRLGKFPRNIEGNNKNRLFPPYPKTIEFTEKGEPLGWLKFEEDG